MSAALGVRIDRRSGIPIYLQLKTQLEYAIATGRLPENTRLPSVRGLAAQLGIAIETVRQAYVELEQQGLATTRHGAGTFTSLPAAQDGRDPAEAQLQTALDSFLEAALAGGAQAETLGRLVAHRLRLLQRGPVAAFVGVRPSVERYARQVMGALPVGLSTVLPVPVEDVRRASEPREEPGEAARRMSGLGALGALPAGVTHVVCLAFHARELQVLLADAPVRVVPIVSELARPVVRTIAGVPGDARLLLVCREESRPIYEDLITPLRPFHEAPAFARADDPEAISDAAGHADVVLHSTVAGELVRQLVRPGPGGPELIELLHSATARSLEAATTVIRSDWEVALRLQGAVARGASDARPNDGAYLQPARDTARDTARDSTPTPEHPQEQELPL